jgi:peptide/nickel transport system permease protein
MDGFTLAPGFWRRMRRNDLATASLAFIIVCGVIAVIGPLVYAGLLPPDRQMLRSDTHQDYDAINAPPSATHWLGTDSYGRDTLARLLIGLRVSITVTLFVELLNIGLGATFGLLAGYFGGWLDMLLSRLADMLFAFPGLLLAILVSAVFGESVSQLYGGMGRLLLVAGSLSLVSWPLMARYVRGQTLSVKEREFTQSARAVGASDRRIVVRHILPNVAGLIIVAATLDVAGVIVNEAVLSLLGLGIQPPGSSIGMMINQAIPYLERNALQVLWPSAALTLLVLAFSFLGDGLRDAFDPQTCT